MVNISLQQGTSGSSAHAYGNQARMRHLEKHGITRLTGETLLRGTACPLDAADRDRARFSPGGLSHRDRDGGSNVRLLEHVSIRH
jgi:hypothetical protein